MTLATGSLTFGAILGTAIVLVITVGCGAVMVMAAITYRREHRGKRFYTAARDEARASFVVALGVLAVSWLIWLWGMWPLAYDYHHWVPVEGKAQKVSKRLVSDGDKGMSQRFVIVIDGRPYGVDDTRAALVKAGDYLKLACKREFEWGVPRESNGWACRWRGEA